MRGLRQWPNWETSPTSAKGHKPTFIPTLQTSRTLGAAARETGKHFQRPAAGSPEGSRRRKYQRRPNSFSMSASFNSTYVGRP